MKAKTTFLALLFVVFCHVAYAQLPLVYGVENTGAGSAAPPLPSFNQLPVVEPLTDPFMWSDGSGRSTNFSDWERRRNEIKAEIEHYEIGTKPNRPETITASFAPNATGGVLTVNVTVNGETLTLTSQVSLPAGTGPFPAVIGMNSLNGSIPAAIFTSRNIARITFSHNQVTSYNNPQSTDPFFRLYPNQNLDNSGQYSAWAWGVSRIIDGLELVQASLPIDLTHLAVTGCSYAGKMALFAGALDERIALTIAQESGGGGAPAWRVSETLGSVEKLGATNYNWFKDDMRQFAGSNVSKLPHDHHELMAMIAPRALLVTGNTDFEWLANPSTYVSARATHEVYKTFGIGDRFGFYIDGGHGHCAIPASQRPAIEAFVDKFMLGNTNVSTDVTVHPYPQINYQRWYQWWGTGTPVLPAEPIGKRIWLEAECATVGSDWDIVADSAAANGSYVTVKSGLNSTATAPAGAGATVVFPFKIDSAATYNFVARLNAPTANDDSYWIKVDDGNFVTVNGLTTSGWQWVRMSSANLSVGEHTLTIAYREDGAHLDKLLVTTSNATITGMGSPGSNCGTEEPTTGCTLVLTTKVTQAEPWYGMWGAMNGAGAIDLTVMGGTAPYTYRWNAGVTTQDLPTAVPGGFYSVTVTDANGCTGTTTTFVGRKNDFLRVLSSHSNVSTMGGSDGSIDLTVVGGVVPATYQWSNGATTEDLTGLSAGTYKVIVTDAFGRKATTTVIISEPGAPLSLSITHQNVSAAGKQDGAVDLTVVGGTGPYTYRWNTGAVTEDLHYAVPGTYSVTVTDAMGATATAMVRVEVGRVPVMMARKPAVNNDIFAPAAGLQAYPNPVVDRATITFTLETAGKYSLDLYDIRGAKVKTIAAGQAQAQEALAVDLQTGTYAKGVYLLKLVTDKGAASKRLMVE